jgi:hypothetical protein
MRLRLRIFSFVAVWAIALSATTGRAADPDFHPVKTEAETIPTIGKCLRQGKEAVLVSDGVHCKDYRRAPLF